MNLRERFLGYCHRYDLIRPGDRVLIGVSGGVDSMVLLDCFAEVRRELKLTLAVCHLNHGLRGEAADGDEKLVRGRCESLGVPFFCEKRDAAAAAAERGISLETAGRELRQRYFADLKNRIHFDRIALGHHADDQAETILLHLVRGAGMRGASGMKPRNGDAIRPLLFASRREVLAHARDRGIVFRTDETNRDTKFRRNRMRHDVLRPLKRSFGEAAIRNLGRFGDNAAEAQDFIDSEVERACSECVRTGLWGEIRLDILPFLRYFMIVRKGILSRVATMVAQRNVSLDSAGYERLMSLAETGRSGRKTVAAGCVAVHRSGNQLIFLESKTRSARAVPVQAGEWVNAGNGVSLKVSAHAGIVDEDELRAKGSRTEFLDADRVRFPLQIRPYRAGDRFVPLGMRSPKRLNRFFIDEKVPHCLRPRIPLLADADGVLWVAGVRMDERAKLTPDTTRVLKVELAFGPPHPNQIP